MDLFRLDGGKIRLTGRIRVVAREDESAEAKAALQAVEEALKASSGVVATADTAETPDYLLTLEPDEFVICDAAGNRIPNLRPAMKVGDADAVRQVIDRLSHLVKYTNVRELDNNDPTSKLSQKFIVEFVSAPPDFKPGSPVRPQPLAALGPSLTVIHGNWAFLRIRNDYVPHVLNVTVLDLQPDWAITQIYPARAGSYETIDPGRELILPLHVTLPEGCRAGTDIIKVFATIDTTSFRSLELPALDRPAARVRSVHGPTNALERFLASFESPKSARAAAVDVCATMEWVAHQVEIEIVNEQQQVLSATQAGH